MECYNQDTKSENLQLIPVASAVTFENVNILNNFEIFESDSKSVPVKLHKYL